MLTRLRLALLLTASFALMACPGSSSDTTDETSGSGDEAAEGENAGGDEAAEEAAEPTEIVLYSGRNEEMVGPIIEAFEAESGIDVVVNYAGSAELAATIMEEGDRSPADVFLAQDASTLGFLEQQGRLATLSDEILGLVGTSYRSANGHWVGVTGRARVLAYNSAAVTSADLPTTLQDLTTPAWRGRVGWAPENASFQSFVATMVAMDGEEATLAWLTAMQANEPTAFPSNTPMVTAIGRGELDVGLTNHYYRYRLVEEHGADFAAVNHYFRDGTAASFVNVTGAGVLTTSDNAEAAQQLIAFLLSETAQTMFVEANHEFPLVNGVESPDGLPAASELNNPEVDLAAIHDLETTHRLLRESGALQ